MTNTVDRNKEYSTILPLLSQKLSFSDNQHKLFYKIAGIASIALVCVKANVSPTVGIITILSMGCYKVYEICKRNKIVQQLEPTHEEACLQEANDCLVTYMALHRDFSLIFLEDWNKRIWNNQVGLKVADWQEMKNQLASVGLNTVEDLKRNQIATLQQLKQYIDKIKFDQMLHVFATVRLYKIKELKDWKYFGIEVNSKEELREVLADYKFTSIEMVRLDGIYSKETLKEYFEEEFNLLWRILTRNYRPHNTVDFDTRITYQLFYGRSFFVNNLEEWKKMGIEAASLSSVKVKLQRIGLKHFKLCDKYGIKTGIDLKNYITSKSSLLAPPRRKFVDISEESRLNLMLRKKLAEQQ